MDIASSSQIPVSELLSVRFDVMVFTYYTHERWNWLFQKVHKNLCRKILLVFEDSPGLNLPEIVNQTEMSDVEILHFKAGDAAGVGAFFTELLAQYLGREMKLLVDYSSMSRPWYAAVIQSILRNNDEGSGRLQVYFATMPPTYFEPAEVKEVGIAGPLLFGTSSSYHKKLALLVGMGYESRAAAKLVSRLNPDQLYLFYADPPFHPMFLEKVLKLNHKLIDQTRKENMIPYPASDLEKADHIITSLILRLRLTHRIMIIPMGPKVFTLTSLLVQSRFPDIEVWNAGFEAWVGAPEIGVNGDPIVYKIEFSED